MDRKIFAFGPVALAAGLLLGAPPAFTAETYAFDKGHTEIRFLWDHAGVSEQSGEFTEFDGELTLDADDVTKSNVSITLKTASISTGVTPLDDDLKSKNFFEVGTYPEITFKSTSIKLSAKESASITGDLTIRGVTKPVTLDANLVHQGEHPLGAFIDYYKGKWLGFNASTSILRSDFDVGLYAPLTSDRIKIVINTEMKAK